MKIFIMKIFIMKIFHLNKKLIMVIINHVTLIYYLDESGDDKVNKKDVASEPGNKLSDMTPTAGIKVCKCISVCVCMCMCAFVWYMYVCMYVCMFVCICM